MANSPKVSVGTVPAEAGSKGELNSQGLSTADRDAVGSSPKTEGPVQHEKTSAYLPAEYPVAEGIVRRDR